MESAIEIEAGFWAFAIVRTEPYQIVKWLLAFISPAVWCLVFFSNKRFISVPNSRYYKSFMVYNPTTWFIPRKIWLCGKMKDLIQSKKYQNPKPLDGCFESCQTSLFPMKLCRQSSTTNNVCLVFFVAIVVLSTSSI